MKALSEEAMFASLIEFDKHESSFGAEDGLHSSLDMFNMVSLDQIRLGYVQH